MFNLTILRPASFSKAQKTVLEIFRDSHSIESLLNSLKSMRFITIGIQISIESTRIGLIDKIDIYGRNAAIFEEVT